MRNSNLATHTIQFHQQSLMLTNERALYWPAQSTLVLSDLHLGKAGHFRKHGIAIPTTVQQHDLHRLKQLLLHFQPRTVLFVGDLAHAQSNPEVESFQYLTQRHPNSNFILIQGNHDRLPLHQWQQLGISTIQTNHRIGPITFTHLPPDSPASSPAIGNNSGPIICGHIHPGVRIPLPDKTTLRLPCYVVSEHQIILPAFSLFTGLDTQHSTPNTTLHAFDKNGFYTL